MKEWRLRGLTDGDAAPRTRMTAPGELDSPRILLDQMPAMFWTTDQGLRITSSLGSALVDLGLGPNQLVGTTLFELFDVAPGRSRTQPIAAHRRALKGTAATFEVVWESREFHGRVAPLYDSEWRVMGTVCVAVEAAGRPISGTGSGESVPAGFVA